MPNNNTASNPPVVGHDRVCAVVQGILRGAQGVWTDESLAQACGVPARTIKSYRVEGKEPSLSNALSLAVVLGGSALNSLLATIGYSARPLDEADEISPAQVVATGLQQFSIIASAAADGRFDHIERPSVQEAADQIIATVLPLSSVGAAA